MVIMILKYMLKISHVASLFEATLGYTELRSIVMILLRLTGTGQYLVPHRTFNS